MTKTLVVLLLIGIMAGATVSVSPVFAIHESEEMVWQVVLISSYPACSNYHYQIKEKYNEITSLYLDLYQQNHKGLEPLCFPGMDFLDEYEKPSEVDLLIVVYDKNGGRDKLQSIGIGGIFSHFGEEWTHNNTIILCDCPNFGFSDPVWTLTHELSHFVLYYLGYPEEIAQEHIHELDRKYDYCMEKKHDPDCYAVKTKLRTTSTAYNWNVLTPYAPAIGKQPVMVPSTPQTSVLDSDLRLEIVHEITGWWEKGHIDDYAYGKALKILVNKMGMEQRPFTEAYSLDARNMILADAGSTIPEDKIDEIENLDMDSRVANLIFESQPFLETELIKAEPEESEEFNFPTWYKTRAQWWMVGNITSYEYLSGINYVVMDNLELEPTQRETEVISLDAETDDLELFDVDEKTELEMKVSQERSKKGIVDCDAKYPVDITIFSKDSATRLYSIDLDKVYFTETDSRLSVDDSIVLRDDNRDDIFDATLSVKASTFCSEVIDNYGTANYSPAGLLIITDSGAYYGDAHFVMKDYL